jgi:ribosomal protein S18 acetylase RimI-like enzyme
MRKNVAVVRLLFPHAAPRLFEGFELLGGQHPPEPHWYLAFVGIKPDLQGRGLGAQLLAPVFERADADGTLCYLETPFQATQAFYRRLGFEITGEEHPVEGAPPVWSMTRRPG